MWWSFGHSFLKVVVDSYNALLSYQLQVIIRMNTDFSSISRWVNVCKIWMMIQMIENVVDCYDNKYLLHGWQTGICWRQLTSRVRRYWNILKYDGEDLCQKHCDGSLKVVFCMLNVIVKQSIYGVCIVIYPPPHPHPCVLISWGWGWAHFFAAQSSPILNQN